MSDFGFQGFGARRKRNIDASIFSKKVNSSSDYLNEPEETYQVKKDTYFHEEPVTHNSTTEKLTNFQEDYQKLTIYLKKELIEELKSLKKSNRISSYSCLINILVKDFLK